MQRVTPLFLHSLAYVPAGFNASRAALRQPWHDIHALVEGPAALDICLNFMERWVKQAGKLHLKDMTHLGGYGDLHLPEGFDTFLVGWVGWGVLLCVCVRVYLGS